MNLEGGELGPGTRAGVLVEHPRILVEAAVHTGLPVTLVRQHVVPGSEHIRMVFDQLNVE